MKKKILCVVMALAVMTSSFIGCGSKDNKSVDSAKEPTTKESVTKEESSEAVAASEGQGVAVDAYAGTTLKVAVFTHALDKSENYGDKLAFAKAAEATGINIEWVPVADGTVTERINVMLSSNDMPDVIIGLLNEQQIALNMESFHDLSKDNLLETYAPNIVADYKTMEGGMQAITWPDGSIRSLMTGRQISYNNNADGIMVINKVWLDQLGLELPKTADEFYEVMKAFRDNDMNGNGDKTDEIPLEFSESNWAAKVMNLANPWGIAGQGAANPEAFKMVKDGKVVPTANTNEFRAFLEYYNKLANEGLVDVEGFSQTNEQYYAKLKEGVVGCYIAWSPYSNFSPEIAANYVVLPPFTAIDGVNPVKTGDRTRLFADRCGFAISATCQNVEAALTWWNYLSSSTEMKYTARLGEKGGAWDIVDGKVIPLTPPGLSDDFTETNYQYTYGTVDRGPFIRADEEMVVAEDPTEATYIRQCMVDQVFDMLPTEKIMPKFTDPEKINERSFIEVELFELINNFIATSIVKGVTDESWNNYLKQLDGARYDEWINWYQQYMD